MVLEAHFLLFQVGHEAFEQAAAGGAPGGGAGFGGFNETIFDDGFGGGMDEVKFSYGIHIKIRVNSK